MIDVSGYIRFVLRMRRGQSSLSESWPSDWGDELRFYLEFETYELS